MTLKNEKIERVIEQCRRRIIKITGQQISLVLIGYTEGDTITFDEIARAVCCALKVSFNRASRKCRKRELVLARHLIFYYSRLYTKLSHQDIAEKLGYNDHTAGVNAVKKVRSLIKARDEIINGSMKTVNQLLKIDQ